MNQRSPGARLLNVVALLVFLSPIFIYWVYCLFINPAPHYDAIDPEYEYFLNSLGVFKHQPYLYVDHPGTPVELIGTAILAATYPFLANRPDGFVTFHLQNPQVFLNLAYGLLALLHLACMLIFFRVSRGPGTSNGAVLSAALATMYFAIQPYAFSGSLLWSHNSFSFPFGTLLLLWLYAILTSERSVDGLPLRETIALGAGAGILAATTIFMAAWAVGILTAIILYHWLRGLPWRGTALAVLTFAFSSIAGFYLAVLPVMERIGGFWHWIYGILSHQSTYLAVPKDQSALERIAANTAQLFRLLPALFAAMLITIGLLAIAFVIWRGQVRERPALWALAGGLGAQIVALTLVFLDRPLRAYYFLGVAAILPVLAMAGLKVYESAPSAHRLLAGAVSAAVLIGLVVNSFQAVGSARARAETVAASGKLIRQVIAEPRGRNAPCAEKHDDPVDVWDLFALLGAMVRRSSYRGRVRPGDCSPLPEPVRADGAGAAAQREGAAAKLALGCRLHLRPLRGRRAGRRARRRGPALSGDPMGLRERGSHSQPISGCSAAALSPSCSTWSKRNHPESWDHAAGPRAERPERKGRLRSHIACMRRRMRE